MNGDSNQAAGKGILRRKGRAAEALSVAWVVGVFVLYLLQFREILTAMLKSVLPP